MMTAGVLQTAPRFVSIGGVSTRYISARHTSGKPPSAPAGVIVVSDVHGIDHRVIVELADGLAARGFEVFIPDIFRGAAWSGQKTSAGYASWEESISMDRVLSDVAATAGFMLSESIANIAILGLGWGGGVAMKASAAVRLNRYKACICVYSSKITLEDVRTIGCPTLFLFREESRLISKLAEMLSTLSIPCSYRLLPGIRADEAAVSVLDAAEWLGLYVACREGAVSLAEKLALSAPTEADWRTRGPGGVFVNKGLDNWNTLRARWNKQTISERPLRPPPIAFEYLAAGLSELHRTFELPGRMCLSDMVEVLNDIWDMDEDGF